MTTWILVIMAYSIGPPVTSHQAMTIPGYESLEECKRAGRYQLWEDKPPHGGKYSTEDFKDNGGVGDVGFYCVMGNDKHQ